MGRQQFGMRPYAQDALDLIGANIRIERANRRWTAAELAARTGCSRRTIQNIEAGRPQVSIGHVMNACAVLGLPLFTPDPQELARLSRAAREKVALIPARVMPLREFDDDF